MSSEPADDDYDPNPKDYRDVEDDLRHENAILMALLRQQGCPDMEQHARSFNEGYETAVAQGLADDPTLAGDWLAERDARIVGPLRAVVDAVLTLCDEAEAGFAGFRNLDSGESSVLLTTRAVRGAIAAAQEVRATDNDKKSARRVQLLPTVDGDQILAIVRKEAAAHGASHALDEIRDAVHGYTEGYWGATAALSRVFIALERASRGVDPKDAEQ